MRHRIKKVKFKGGKDANDMLVRKLAVNFFRKGKLTTTVSKAKVLKSIIERLVEKAKEKTESNKNHLLRFGIPKDLIYLLFESIGPALKNTIGGYVKVIRLGFRQSDGSVVASVEWAYPIVIETPKTETKEDKKKSTEPKKREKSLNKK